MVEYLFCKQDVAGSSPVFGSNGAMTERLGAGLQNLLGWFDSNWRLKNNKREHRWQQRKFATSLQEVGVLNTFDYRNTGCNTYSLSKGSWITMIDG